LFTIVKIITLNTSKKVDDYYLTTVLKFLKKEKKFTNPNALTRPGYNIYQNIIYLKSI